MIFSRDAEPFTLFTLSGAHTLSPSNDTMLNYGGGGAASIVNDPYLSRGGHSPGANNYVSGSGYPAATSTQQQYQQYYGAGGGAPSPTAAAAPYPSMPSSLMDQVPVQQPVYPVQQQYYGQQHNGGALASTAPPSQVRWG